MLNRKQKMLLHIYKDAAGINDPTYRSIIQSSAGVSSAGDSRFSQSGFEHAMAKLETVLFQRVHAREIADPRGLVKWIGKEYYWRDKLPKDHLLNARQRYTIEQLWRRLKEFLPDDKCTDAYLRGIIKKATGRETGPLELSRAEAGLVLDALRDRMASAIKACNKEPVPF